MAVSIHLILKDDGVSQIMRTCDVHGRDGSIKLRNLLLGGIIPTDPLTGDGSHFRHYA